MYTEELKIFSDVADPSTPFVVKVDQNRLIGKDEVVATLTDTIGGVLGRLKDGGTRLLLRGVLLLMRSLRTKCLKSLFETMPLMGPVSLG